MERERYEEEEREVLEAWRETGQRVAAAMNAADEARKALEAAREEELQARIDLLKTQKVYLAAKEVRRKALKVRRQAFKACRRDSFCHCQRRSCRYWRTTLLLPILRML
jgi:hypothetical protein